MIPIRIRGATNRMRLPKEFLGKLPRLFVRVRLGLVSSRWEPTPSELDLLNQGGSVELMVFGPLPPVHLRVVKRETDEFD